MLEQAFLDFGYTKKEYETIRNTYPIVNLKDETLLNSFRNITKFLSDMGYSKPDIIRMTNDLPQLFGYSEDNIKQKIDDIVSLGYKREEVISMTKRVPAIFSLGIETIIQKKNDLISLGFSENNIIKMSKRAPSLFNYGIDNIKRKMDDLMVLGFAKENIIKMITTSPAIFSYSIETIKQKIDDIMALGYTKEDVIGMMISLPSLMGASIEGIREKVNFYDSINMHDLPIVNPKNLMQSTKLSYARYIFLTERGQKIDMTSYGDLFIGNKKFEKQYGITKEKLIEKYNYERYLEERKNERTI